MTDGCPRGICPNSSHGHIFFVFTPVIELSFKQDVAYLSGVRILGLRAVSVGKLPSGSEPRHGDSIQVCRSLSKSSTRAVKVRLLHLGLVDG